MNLINYGELTEFNRSPVFLFRNVKDKNCQELTFFDIENFQIKFQLNFENNYSVIAEFYLENIYLQNDQTLLVLNSKGEVLKECNGLNFFSKGLIFQSQGVSFEGIFYYNVYSYSQDRNLFLIETGKWSRFFAGYQSILIFLKSKDGKQIFRIYKTLNGEFINEILLNYELPELLKFGFYVKKIFELGPVFIVNVSGNWALGISQDTGKILWKLKLDAFGDIIVVDEGIFVVTKTRCFQIDSQSGVELENGILIYFPENEIEDYGMSNINRGFCVNGNLMLGRISEDHTAILLYSNGQKKYSPISLREIEKGSNFILNKFNNFYIYNNKLLVSCFNNISIALEYDV